MCPSSVSYQSAYYSKKVVKISGDVKVPGDKSMSHRALMFGALADGETRITGLLEGHDVLNTAQAMRHLGGVAVRGDDGIWRCSAPENGELHEPSEILDMGNSGTSARLLMGLVAGYGFSTIFTGDASLKKRPMGRVMRPLSEMGARFISRDKGRFPLAVEGVPSPKAVTYESPVASAQVKSAILLAGLRAAGTTTVIETAPSRDHSENMLRAFGAEVDVENLPEGRFAVSITGGARLEGCSLHIPADPSSAAFPAAACAMHPGSAVTLLGVGINPRRTGFYQCLEEMGVDILYRNKRVEGGEEVADIKILAPEKLVAIDIPPERVPSMIDEFPAIAMLAACADGVSRMSGLEELRVKESDRLALVAKGLTDCGVRLEESESGLIIHGNGKPPQGGAMIETALDHRIAMSFLVLGSVSDEPVQIDDITPVGTSFPGFVALMNDLGMDIAPCGEDANDRKTA